jgi:hypothetical protein
MTDLNTTGEGFGAKALTLAMILGAALLLLEITWSPVMQAPHAAAVSTATVTAHPDRLAQN